MQLRPYQTEALKASKEEFGLGTNRQLLTLPTGMGKTVVFAKIAEHHGITKRSLVLVHRDELATQAADKIGKWNPTYKIGVEMGGSYAADNARVVVGGVQTLGRAGDNRRLAALKPDDFGLIICDEAHHSTASTYQNVFRHFRLLGETPRKDILLFGCTATPKRGDGEGLSSTYDKIIYDYSMLQGIKDGWLVNMRGFRLRTHACLDDVHTVAGDFNQSELAKTINI